jgi:hypothetical protein
VKQIQKPYLGLIGITSTAAGEMTHTDLWGPACTTSISGTKYFMTFINDYSWNCTVKFLKHKNDAINKVQEYLTFIERQQEMLPKHLCADNGKEYVNNELINWCHTKGIQLELTAPEVGKARAARWEQYAKGRLMAKTAPDFPTNKHCKALGELTCKGGSVWSQLKTGHVRLNKHLYRIKVADSPMCPSVRNMRSPWSTFYCTAKLTSRRGRYSKGE